MKSLLPLLLLGALSLQAGEPPSAVDPLRIVIVGDSTVCDYPAENPCRGWGQFIAESFPPPAEVRNFAAGGRSTKTFIWEGRWAAALATKPTFVLIQFGHNDSHEPSRPEATHAATDYKEFLDKYVDGARAAGATPILITPMHRRNFGSDGKLADILLPYATAMKEVAAEKGVAVIDLHASSGALFQRLGDLRCRELANAESDHTHFNEKGARAIAELILNELPRVEPRLKPKGKAAEN